MPRRESTQGPDPVLLAARVAELERRLDALTLERHEAVQEAEQHASEADELEEKIAELERVLGALAQVRELRVDQDGMAWAFLRDGRYLEGDSPLAVLRQATGANPEG